MSMKLFKRWFGAILATRSGCYGTYQPVKGSRCPTSAPAGGHASVGSLEELSLVFFCVPDFIIQDDRFRNFPH